MINYLSPKRPMAAMLYTGRNIDEVRNFIEDEILGYPVLDLRVGEKQVLEITLKWPNKDEDEDTILIPCDFWVVSGGKDSGSMMAMRGSYVKKYWNIAEGTE